MSIRGQFANQIKIKNCRRISTFDHKDCNPGTKFEKGNPTVSGTVERGICGKAKIWSIPSPFCERYDSTDPQGQPPSFKVASLQLLGEVPLSRLYGRLSSSQWRTKDSLA